MTRSAALLALLAAAPLAPAQTAAPPTPVVASFAPPGAPYAGLYATDGGMVEVRPSGAGIALVAHGAPVAARLRALGETDAATDARAMMLLDAWITGDLAAVAAAARPAHRPAAAEALAAYRTALVRGHGEVFAGSVVETFRQTDGRKATLVQLLFDRGSEWASLVWDENGDLVTMTRGLSPVVVGTAEATSSDTFVGAGVGIRFERGQDGRIETIRVDDRFVAIR